LNIHHWILFITAFNGILLQKTICIFKLPRFTRSNLLFHSRLTKKIVSVYSDYTWNDLRIWISRSIQINIKKWSSVGTRGPGGCFWRKKLLSKISCKCGTSEVTGTWHRIASELYQRLCLHLDMWRRISTNF
jgi:hypothetical protein